MKEVRVCNLPPLLILIEEIWTVGWYDSKVSSELPYINQGYFQTLEEAEKLVGNLRRNYFIPGLSFKPYLYATTKYRKGLSMLFSIKIIENPYLCFNEVVKRAINAKDYYPYKEKTNGSKSNKTNTKEE